MGILIRFELRKILGNRAGMIACAFALAMLAALSAMNLMTAMTRDFATGEPVSGIEAQRSFRQLAESHAGVLDDGHVAADAATLDRANQAAGELGGFYDMNGGEIIAARGLEFWRETMGVISQTYYMEVVGTLDSTSPRATSLEEGARARIDGMLDQGFMNHFPYSEAERAYWTEKAAGITWPVQYGYADGWRNVLNWVSFSGLVIVALCIALSGTFAGEYQTRAASVALPTRRGKRALPAAKAIAALVFATAYWWICALIVIAINIGICGADGWSLPLQAVLDFGNPYPLTVGQTVLALYALGYCMALGMAALTLLLSSKMRSTMPVAVIPMAIVFLGMFLLFITPLAKVAALTPLSGLNYAFGRMVSYAAGPAVADLPTVLAALYGIMLVALTPLAMLAFRRHQVA